MEQTSYSDRVKEAMDKSWKEAAQQGTTQIVQSEINFGNFHGIRNDPLGAYQFPKYSDIPKPKKASLGMHWQSVEELEGEKANDGRQPILGEDCGTKSKSKDSGSPVALDSGLTRCLPKPPEAGAVKHKAAEVLGDDDFLDYVVIHNKREIEEYANEQGIDIDQAAEEVCEEIIMTIGTKDMEKAIREQRRVEKGRGIVHQNPKELRTLKTVEPEGLMCVETSGDWEEVEMAVDSGATETVVGENMVTSIETKEGPASRRGVNYEVADGTLIPNLGEKKFTAVSEEGLARNITAQVCSVNKALLSVKKMVKAGNKVVFDEEGSYVEDKRTGEKMWMKEDGGMYMLKMWVKKVF